MGDEHLVRTERVATGGEVVARMEDGRVVFVSGSVPEELVRVELTEVKKRFARARTVEVLDAGPSRVPAACAHAARGECGGCDWLHIDRHAQRDFKREIVVEQLQRLGGIEDPRVDICPDETGRRVTVRCAITTGRAGYRRGRSADRFAAFECGAVHPDLEPLVTEGRYGDADEVTLRLGAGTGDRMAVLHPSAPATDGSLSLPDDVSIVDASEPGDASFDTIVVGRRWRVSALAFFQTSDLGAESLVATVRSVLDGSSGDVVDLYGGGGLLGGGATPDRLHTVVESAPAAVADAAHNLPGARIVHDRVERWIPDRTFGAVIADPARSGLRAGGVATVDATGADRLALVSCDPAALGRDAALLLESGWRHTGSTVIDMFPDTSRIEVVSGFVRP